MKKYMFVLLCLCAAAALPASDWTYSLGLASGVPAMNTKVKHNSMSGTSTVSGFGVGWDASLDFRGVNEANNWAFLASYGIGYLKIRYSGASDAELSSSDGFIHSIRLGGGKRLIDKERLSLTANGILGFVITAQSGSTHYNSYTKHSDETVFDCLLGAELYASYRLNWRWSVVCSATALVNLGGSATLKNRVSGDSTSYSATVNGSPQAGTFALFPRIGICYTF